MDGKFEAGLGMNFQKSYSDILELKMPTRKNGKYKKGAEPEIVWSWNIDGSENYFSPFMSGWDRLPNGNTIFVNAHNKQVIEVTPDGERVLDYLVPHNGRKYRVYKFGPDHPALKGRL